MLSLSATFENSAGRRHSLRIKDPDRKKPAEEIRASLEKLVRLNLFEKDEVGLFKKLISAKFVETIETPLFDLREEDSQETVEHQPEAIQVAEVSQPESDQIQEIPQAVQSDAYPAVGRQATAAIEAQLAGSQAYANSATEVPSTDPSEQLGERQQLEIMIPEDLDVASLSEEDLMAMLQASLPEGAVLESFSLEDIVVGVEESGTQPTANSSPQSSLENTTTTINTPPEEPVESSLEEPAPENKPKWFPKRNVSNNPLAGFSMDKRKNKKALNRLKRNKKK